MFWYCLISLLSATLVLSTEIDYYWRNYNGDVPNDAFEAGRDASGKPIYIGQGFFQNAGLLPGTLRKGSTHLKATAQYKVFSTDKYVKILCTRHPHNLRWIRVNTKADISALTDVHIFQGGLETNSILYVGRAIHEGDLEIGKIYNLGTYKGLAFPNRDGSETDYTGFDLLVFDLNVIDVRYNAVSVD